MFNLKNQYKKIITAAFVLIFSLLSAIYAQNSNLNFERLSLKEGLSQSTVYSIIQDSEGFMWFGTQDGLNKYNGYNFNIYKHNKLDSTSLSDNYINKCYEDKEGNIWIGTFSGGLNKFDKNTEQFKHYLHDPDNPNSLQSNNIWTIYEDRSGTLWIGTLKGGLSNFNKEKETFTNYMHDSLNTNSLNDNDVWAIFEDESGIIWLGTFGGGLNKFDVKKGKFTHYIHDDDNPNSLSNDYIRCIYEDSSGFLWIGTEEGLDKFDKKFGQFIHYKHDPKNPYSLSHNDVRSIFEDKTGNLWVGTINGLNLFNREKEIFISYKYDPTNLSSLSNSDIRSIYTDKTGALWIGTLAGGVNKYDRKKDRFRHYKHNPTNPNSLSNNFIKAIYKDRDGTLWIGTYGGLNKLVYKPGISGIKDNYYFIHYRHNPDDINSISSDRTRTIFEDSKGVLWVGTWGGGLNKFDKTTEKFTHYIHDPDDPNSINDDWVRKIFKDKDGILWIVNSEGLDKFDREKEIFIHYVHDPTDPTSISSNNVSTIFETKDDTLWLGTDNGLNKFDKINGTFTHYTHDPSDSNSISINRIRPIHEDKSGILWIGSDGGGLNRFDRKNGKFTCFTENDGLPNDVIYGILEDDNGNIWLSTNNGLSNFNPSRPEAKKFKNYDISDGLQSNEFNGGAYFKAENGEIFFGGVNGINSFFPDRLKDNTYIPPIVITSFKVFDEDVKFDLVISKIKEIKLSYKQSFFSFEFAALDFTSPEKNQYAYKLEGFDSDWIMCGNRRYASYTNLDGGEYIFKVKGSNNDGIWNETGASVKIVITPPYWKTSLFRIVFSILIIGFLFGTYKIRIDRINKQKEKLEYMVNERTEEIKERNKLLFKIKKETDNILQNVEEGFFLLNQQFQVESQYSKSLKKILGDQEPANKNFIELIKRKISSKELTTANEYIELMFNDDIDEQMINELNPLSKIEFNLMGTDGSMPASKYLSFKFQRIHNKEGKTIELIVTVNDITDQVNLAQQLETTEANTKKQMEWLLSILHVEPELLREFIESGQKELDYIDDVLKYNEKEADYNASLENIFRSMHLIKGNASLLDLKFFVKKTHDFEETISVIKKKTDIKGSDFVPLVLQLSEMRKTILELENLIVRISKIRTHFRPKRSYENKLFIDSIQNLINNLAEDLGKEIKFIHNDFDAGVIPYKYRLMTKEILIQLVRNAVSHGIENIDERANLKKPPYGSIEISSFVDNNSFGLNFRDDGRGLQIEKLRQKAKDSGKWDNAEIDKWDAKQAADIIFTHGISTSEKADFIAGRGIGMDIINQKLKQHNGRIDVSFVEGEYCDFTIILPINRKNV
jgi:ligand-binding sensor domain-containing protein/signal transduction histidine kinase